MKTKKYKRKKSRKSRKSKKSRKYRLGGYNQPSDINSVKLLLRSKLPGVLADKIAREGTSQLPHNLVNQLHPRATELQNRYAQYERLLKLNKYHLDSAKARWPEAFTPPPPGLDERAPVPMRHIRYNWTPKGELDEQGRPVKEEQDRMAREIMSNNY